MEEWLLSLSLPRPHATDYSTGRRRCLAGFPANFWYSFWHSAILKNQCISFTQSLFDCRQWNEKLLEEACTSLAEEMSLSPSAPGGMVTYRRTLTISLFYKFFLTVQHKLAVDLRMEVFNIVLCTLTQSRVWKILLGSKTCTSNLNYLNEKKKKHFNGQ